MVGTVPMLKGKSFSASQFGKWISLGVPASELRCDMTLVNGQCFGWQADACDKGKEWTGVLGRCVVSFRQEENDTLYLERFPGCTPGLDSHIRDYLNLDNFCLRDMYRRWSDADQRLRDLAPYLPGLRVLRQEPVECLFSFLCSSNNNISRITQMLDALRRNHGDLLWESNGRSYYTFPKLENLAAIEEQKLRDLGFGYRAKFIVKSAVTVSEKGGEEWLRGLRQKPREEVGIV